MRVGNSVGVIKIKDIHSVFKVIIKVIKHLVIHI